MMVSGAPLYHDRFMTVTWQMAAAAHLSQALGARGVRVHDLEHEQLAHEVGKVALKVEGLVPHL